MSLIESMFELCVMLDKTSVPDGIGGFNYNWVEGAAFDAAIIKQSNPTITVAEQQGLNEQYLVVLKAGVPLQFHDVFKRLSDNAVFRVTGNARDTEPPAQSTVQIEKVTAERWTIPA